MLSFPVMTRPLFVRISDEADTEVRAVAEATGQSLATVVDALICDAAGIPHPIVGLTRSAWRARKRERSTPHESQADRPA